MDIILFIVCVAIACALIVSYIRNFVVTIRNLRSQDYSLMLFARFLGIFFPILGVVLGFV